MNTFQVFKDRVEAGRMLAERLLKKHYEKPVVLALPRGGVPVAAEIASALQAPLDLVLVRKIGVPSQPELAAAAVVDGDHPEMVVNEEILEFMRVSSEYLESARDRELAEIERRRALYVKGRPRLPLEGRSVIVVDDGIATGATVRAAIKALRRRKPAKLVLAVAVAPNDTIERLRPDVDEIICLAMPEPFIAIGLYYRDFRQLSDDEIIALLADAAGEPVATEE